MASTAHGAGGVLLGMPGAGAGIPRPARSAVGRAGADRHPAALHADTHLVGRRRPGGLPHQHRRVHRGRPLAAAALGVSGTRRHADQRSGGRRRRAGFRVAARGARIGGHRPASVDPGQPGLRLVRVVLGGAGTRRRWGARGVGGRGGVADGDGVRPDGARPDGRAGPRGRHRDLQRRRQAALRPPRCRFQSAGRQDRARWAGPQHVHQGRAGRGRPGLHRRTAAAAGEDRHGQGVGAGREPVGAGLAARRGLAGTVRAAGAGDRRPRREAPARRGGVAGRRPGRRRDRRAPAGRAANGAVRGSHGRAAQPWGAQLRRRLRGHPAHRADAVVHRLALRGLDRPAATHRPGWLEFPTPALDPPLRLRACLRRRRLAARRHPGAQRAVLPPAACGGAATATGRAAGGRLAAARRAGRLGAAGRAQGGRQPAGRRQRAAGPTRRGGAAIGANDRSRHPGHHRLRAGQGRRPPAGRPAGNAARNGKGAQVVHRPARLSGRHRAGPARRGR
ncbi:Uncharacterised protein [Mycobacterium tuberculosis]|nr:Uncharacterised protein [Mycobacterium tuberculosis]